MGNVVIPLQLYIIYILPKTSHKYPSVVISLQLYIIYISFHLISVQARVVISLQLYIIYITLSTQYYKSTHYKWFP